jgi:hypothetical protein
MQPVRQPNHLTADTPNLVGRRTELEAKLLAHRCGWLASDEIKVRKLERALAEVLAEIGRDDPMARRLISR